MKNRAAQLADLISILIDDGVDPDFAYNIAQDILDYVEDECLGKKS